MEGKGEKLAVIFPKVSVNSALRSLCHLASSCKEKGESSMLSVRLIRGRTQTKQADTVLLSQSLSPKKMSTPPPPPSSQGCWGRGETSLTWNTRGETKINSKLPGTFSEWEARLVLPAWRSLGVARLKVGVSEKLLLGQFRWRETEQAPGSSLFSGNLLRAGNPLRGDYFESCLQQMYSLQKSTWR